MCGCGAVRRRLLFAAKKRQPLVLSVLVRSIYSRNRSASRCRAFGENAEKHKSIRMFLPICSDSGLLQQLQQQTQQCNVDIPLTTVVVQEKCYHIFGGVYAIDSRVSSIARESSQVWRLEKKGRNSRSSIPTSTVAYR